MKKNIFMILLLLLSFSSCGDEEPRYTVPRSEVYFLINMNSPEDRGLKDLGGMKMYTKKRSEMDMMGFGGLLVINSTNGLAAFDLACPYEDRADTRVEQKAGNINVFCPKCGSEYSVYDGIGYARSGPSKEPLQRYRISQISNFGEYRVTR